jgi:hypothetical protein
MDATVQKVVVLRARLMENRGYDVALPNEEQGLATEPRA